MRVGVIIMMGVCLGLRATVAATNVDGTVATPALVGAAGSVREDFEQGFARVVALQQAAEFRDAIQFGMSLESGHRNHPDIGRLNDILQRLREQKRMAAFLSYAVEKLGSSDPREVQAAKEQLAEDPELTRLLLCRAVRVASGDAAIGAVKALREDPEVKSAAALADRLAVEPPGRLAQALSAALVRQVDGLAEQPEADRAALTESFGRLYQMVAADADIARTDLADPLLRVISGWFHGQAKDFDALLDQPGAYASLSDHVKRAYASTNTELVAWAYRGFSAMGLENTDGLIGWWQFDEDSGHIAKDSSPDNRHGILTGAVTRCEGRVKGGLSFDGVGAQVVEQGDAFASVTNTFTMALWASPSASRSPDVERTSGSGVNMRDQRYAIYPRHGEGYGAGHAGAGLSIGVNGISVVEHAAGYIPSLLMYEGEITGWTHVVVVYENQQPTLYLNGELVKTGLVSTMNVHPGSSFGCQAGDYGCYAGLLDDVRIYNRALSAKEVKGLALQR